MDLKKPVVIIEDKQVIITKQFLDDEYLLIDSETKQVALYENNQIINVYSDINNQYAAFINPEANKITIIKVDSPSTGVKFDIMYKKWVMD